MRKTTALLLLVVILICLAACANKDNQDLENTTKYNQSDVRNRNLKEAIENYNNGFFKATISSISRARVQRLRDEDIELMTNLELEIGAKTELAVDRLDSLSTQANLSDYDSFYNTIHSNYEISSFRQRIDKSKESYLTKVKKENDAHLEKYYAYIQEINNKTILSLENCHQIYRSKTSPLKLVVTIDGYQEPKAVLEFHPSQKEPELETIKFSTSNTNIVYEKGNQVISEYNLSVSKIITFDLALTEAKMNFTTFKQMLDDGKIKINLKWFYEPEQVNVSTTNINRLKELLDTYQKLHDEYKANEGNIYVPRYVR